MQKHILAHMRGHKLVVKSKVSRFLSSVNIWFHLCAKKKKKEDEEELDQRNWIEREKSKGKSIISTVYDLEHGKYCTDNHLFDLELYAIFFSIQLLKLATRV